MILVIFLPRKANERTEKWAGMRRRLKWGAKTLIMTHRKATQNDNTLPFWKHCNAAKAREPKTRKHTRIFTRTSPNEQRVSLWLSLEKWKLDMHFHSHPKHLLLPAIFSNGKVIIKGGMMCILGNFTNPFHHKEALLDLQRLAHRLQPSCGF